MLISYPPGSRFSQAWRRLRPLRWRGLVCIDCSRPARPAVIAVAIEIFTVQLLRILKTSGSQQSLAGILSRRQHPIGRFAIVIDRDGFAVESDSLTVVASAGAISPSSIATPILEIMSSEFRSKILSAASDGSAAAFFSRSLPLRVLSLCLS